MTFEIYKDSPLLTFSMESEWTAWLSDNYSSVLSIWMKFAKKYSGALTISYEEARDAAIAFGWIDGLINRYDDQYYVTRFTPRKPKSVWSKINCEIAESLIQSGKMHPAGLAHVQAAKADGRWDRAYDGASKMTVPEDFLLALEQNPAAAMNFAELDASNRYALLWRIQTASIETRAKKISKFVNMLEKGEVFHLKSDSV